MVKKKLKTEPVVVKAPKSKPHCPMHSMTMEYDPMRSVWACPVETCAQIAFPPNEVAKGKPIVGQGVLEMLLVKDPGGSKRGRVLLRAIESNIILDITDYVTELTTEVQPATLKVPNPRSKVFIELSLEHWLDNRDYSG